MNNRKDYWNYFRTKIWPDPVWSKVISAGILGLITLIFVTVTSIISKISFATALSLVWFFLSQGTLINNALFILLLLFALYGVYNYLNSLILKKDVESSTEEEIGEVKKELLSVPLVASALFETRVQVLFLAIWGLFGITTPK